MEELHGKIGTSSNVAFTRAKWSGPTSLQPAVSYDILKGGQGREEKIVKVIQAVDPEVVVVQEAQGVASFQSIAQALEMTAHLAESQRRSSLRVGLLLAHCRSAMRTSFAPVDSRA